MSAWTPFDYEDKNATKPPTETDGDLFWIIDDFYYGVTAGYFDGFTWRNWQGSDDICVTHWMPMAQPPKEPVTKDNFFTADPYELTRCIHRIGLEHWCGQCGTLRKVVGPNETRLRIPQRLS
jgi:hypothetical protein